MPELLIILYVVLSSDEIVPAFIKLFIFDVSVSSIVPSLVNVPSTVVEPLVTILPVLFISLRVSLPKRLAVLELVKELMKLTLEVSIVPSFLIEEYMLESAILRESLLITLLSASLEEALMITLLSETEPRMLLIAIELLSKVTFLIVAEALLLLSSRAVEPA